MPPLSSKISIYSAATRHPGCELTGQCQRRLHELTFHPDAQRRTVLRAHIGKVPLNLLGSVRLASRYMLHLRCEGHALVLPGILVNAEEIVWPSLKSILRHNIRHSLALTVEDGICLLRQAKPRSLFG